jgi:hypothetical protein
VITATSNPAEWEQAVAQLYSRITMGDLEDALAETVEPLRRDAELQLIQQAARGPYSTGRTAEAGVKKVLSHDSDGQPYMVVGMIRKGKGARQHIGYWLDVGIPSRGIAARPWWRPAEAKHRGQFLPRFVAAMRKRLGMG